MFNTYRKVISKKNIDFLLKEITEQRLAFYLKHNKESEPTAPILYHQILKRREDRNSSEPVWNTTPEYEKLFTNIFEDFCKKASINSTEIYRACLNLTFYVGIKKCAPHSDHTYPYRQLLIYLNDADPKSKTVILDKKNKIIKKITPQKNKGIMFDSSPHYHFFPTFGCRMVLIYTFK